MSPTALKRRHMARTPAKRASLRNQMVSLYGRSCWLCGRGIALGDVISIDHVHPLSKGGSSKIHNLRPAHERCNRKRGNGPVPELLLAEVYRAAIAMEARQGGDGETRPHPKDDSAGAKHIAQRDAHGRLIVRIG